MMTRTSNRFVEVEESQDARLRSVVFYGTIAAGKAAAHFLASLEQASGESSILADSMWRLDQLGLTESGKEAACAAAESDLLIFSSSHKTPASQEIKTWMETWLDLRPPKPGALILLLDKEERIRTSRIWSPPPLWDFLRGMAHQAGIDFLSEHWSVWLPSSPARIGGSGPSGRQGKLIQIAANWIAFQQKQASFHSQHRP